MFRTFKMDTVTVKKGAFTPIKSLKAYGLHNSQNEQQQHLIQGFHEVGWPDPFPRPLLV